MLEAIRKRSASLVVKILFGLLILSFAAWGIGDIFRGRAGSQVIASVGDADITPEQFNLEYQREMRRLQTRLGTAFDAEQARAMGIPRMVLSNLVESTLSELAANELGISISDGLVRSEIQGNKVFHNTLGRFDRNLFNDILQTNGYSEDQFATLIRGDLVRSQLLETVATGAAVPRTMVETLYRFRQQERIAGTVFVPDEAMKGIGEPDDGTLAKFHQDNAKQFTAPEYRALTAVVLEVDELAKEISVADEKVREAFDQRADQFNVPERRNIQQMVIDDEADAKRAKALLDEGKDFVEVAKEVAKQEAGALDLGLMDRDKLLPELAEVAFTLDTGAVSAPVRSLLGWHLKRVIAIEPARTRTLEEMRETITAELARDEAIDSMFDLANKLEDSLGGGSTLEEAASSLGLRILEIAAIDARGRGRDGKQVEDLPPGRGQFVTTAFQTPEGEESVLTEAGTDGYFIVRVDRIIEPALRPLAEVSAEVTGAWKAEERKKAAETAAKALLEAVKGGTAPEAAAKDGSFTYKSTGAFTRAPGGDHGLPQDLVTALFAAAPGEAAMGRAAEGYYVARLEEVKEADPGADKDGMDALGEQLRRSLQGSLLSQFSAALRQQYPVKVNESLTNELF